MAGEYCYTVSGFLTTANPHKDTFFVQSGRVWRVERVFSTGLVVHPKIPGQTYEQVYQDCTSKVVPVLASQAESLLIETNAENLLIRYASVIISLTLSCYVVPKANSTATGFYELAPKTGSCSSVMTWMVPMFVFIPLVFAALLFGLVALTESLCLIFQVAYLHKVSPGKVLPSEGELESFLSGHSEPPRKASTPTESRGGRLVINETPGPVVLEDELPDENDNVYHSARGPARASYPTTQLVNPQQASQQQPPRATGTLGELPKRPQLATSQALPNTTTNPYYVASPTPLSFGGGMSISSQPYTPQEEVVNPGSSAGTGGGMFSGLDVSPVPVRAPTSQTTSISQQGGLFAGMNTL